MSTSRCEMAGKVQRLALDSAMAEADSDRSDARKEPSTLGLQLTALSFSSLQGSLLPASRREQESLNQRRVHTTDLAGEQQAAHLV